MKTTLRYLLIVVATVSFLSVSAQGLAQQPIAQMQSTSGMVYSGSQLPQAAAEGTYVTGNTLGTYVPANAPGLRKGSINGGSDPGSGSGGPGDRPEPYEDPIGDAMWPLLLMAFAYVCVLFKRCKV